jgi:hypothetical protein
MVPIRIANQDTRVHLDTGSGYGVMLPTRFLETLPLASAPVAAGKVRMLRGEFPVSTAVVKGPLEIGTHTVPLSEVRFVDLKHGDVAGPGKIGYEVLRTFAVTLDSKNRRIRLAR